MTVHNVVLQDLVVPAELPYRKNTPSKPHVAMRGYYEGEWLPNISLSLVAILTLSVREGALWVRVRASFSSVVQMAVAGGSKIVKPCGEKLDKFEELVSHVSTERRDGEDLCCPDDVMMY